MKIEDRIILGTLLERYGALLTPSQREIMSSYCLFDLSLGEIAIERGTSRAAVEDALKKAIKKLENYEEALGLSKKRDHLLKLLREGDLKTLEDEINGI